MHPTFHDSSRCTARVKRVRLQNPSQRRVKHTERLVQKYFVKRLASALSEIESVTNRANRLRVIRRTNDRRRATEDTERRSARPFFSPPRVVVRRRACS